MQLVSRATDFTHIHSSLFIRPTHHPSSSRLGPPSNFISLLTPPSSHPLRRPVLFPPPLAPVLVLPPPLHVPVPIPLLGKDVIRAVVPGPVAAVALPTRTVGVPGAGVEVEWQVLLVAVEVDRVIDAHELGEHAGALPALVSTPAAAAVHDGRQGHGRLLACTWMAGTLPAGAGQCLWPRGARWSRLEVRSRMDTGGRTWSGRGRQGKVVKCSTRSFHLDRRLSRGSRFRGASNVPEILHAPNCQGLDCMANLGSQ